MALIHENTDHHPRRGQSTHYTFDLDGENVQVRPKKETLQSALPLPLASLGLAPDTHHDARRLALGWDMHVLEQEWCSWVIEKGTAVKDPDKHFLFFCKKRGAYRR